MYVQVISDSIIALFVSPGSYTTGHFVLSPLLEALSCSLMTLDDEAEIALCLMSISVGRCARISNTDFVFSHT
jgi:hypothetical protein